MAEAARRVISVRADRFGGWPLWENGEQLEPTALLLPDGFTLSFLRWHALWLRHHSLSGWDSPQNEVRYWHHGGRMIEIVRQALGAGFEVRDERDALSPDARILFERGRG